MGSPFVSDIGNLAIEEVMGTEKKGKMGGWTRGAIELPRAGASDERMKPDEAAKPLKRASRREEAAIAADERRADNERTAKGSERGGGKGPSEPNLFSRSPCGLTNEGERGAAAGRRYLSVRHKSQDVPKKPTDRADRCPDGRLSHDGTASTRKGSAAFSS